MPERVSTGGTKTFEYGKSHNPRLSSEEKKKIERAYQKAEERKSREKRNKSIIVIVIVLAILAIAGYFLLT